MKIEKGIPVPARNRLSKQSDELKQLRKGDSFLIEEKYKNQSEYQKVVNGYYVAARRLGIKIATRKQDEGVRLWRTE